MWSAELRQTFDCLGSATTTAKAVAHFAALTARLKPCPFKTRSKSGFSAASEGADTSPATHRKVGSSTSVHRTTESIALATNRSHLLQRRLDGRLQQLLGICLWITTTEHGVACHQNFCSRPNHLGHRVERHAAIHFDAEI
jgi:hypothetical protein